jgi:hypothetical protein
MPHYKDGKLYKLTNDIDDVEYVGSTCRSLDLRRRGHEKDSRNETERPVYAYLNWIGWEYVNIVLLEDFPCKNKKQLQKRERYWIEKLKPDLNAVIPTRTDQEYRADTKEHKKQYNKEYLEKNKARLKIQEKAKITCECGQTTTYKHKARHYRTAKHQVFLKLQL